MLVVITSECSDEARDRSQKILDDFLSRIGRRTWSGRITQQGLDRLKKVLAKTATRSTSLCCQRVVGTRRLTVEWFIGNRKKFDRQGNCAVRETERMYALERDSSSFERLCAAASNLAALFHDLGKSTEWFQKKLRSAAVLSDAVRHELVSAAIVEAMFSAFPSEEACLDALSEVSKIPTIIETAYAEALEKPERYLFRSTDDRFKRLLSTIVNGKDAPCETLSIRFSQDTPKRSILQALILTHHRLPGGGPKKDLTLRMTVDRLVNRPKSFSERDRASLRASTTKELEQIFSLPKGLVPIWKDEAWVASIADAAKAYREATVTDFGSDLKACSIYGRTALILGDHKASAIGNTRYPEEGTVPAPDRVYANTNGKTRALAEHLSSHLVRVRNETDTAGRVLFAMRNDFPGIEREEIPEAISAPRAEKGSRFRWQTDAGRAVRKAMADLPEEAGFFGILKAGTGAGKTRAAPVVMTAVNERKTHDLRLNMCTGLRSLTLQAGREYRSDMKFREEDVSVVIGDKLSIELFEASKEASPIAVGTEASKLDEHLTVQLDLGIPTRPLPFEAMRLAGSEMSDPNVSLLAAPILVSTIDILMAAADAQRGSHVLKTLRVATADLVIDEIDSFGNEDIAAICRMVYLSASFGRSVLISSATITPEIASAMYDSYRAGWKVFEHVIGKQVPKVVGWLSNTAAPICEIDPDNGDFLETHRVFTDAMISEMNTQMPRRKLRVASGEGIENAAQYFERVNAEIRVEHENNHLLDEITGRRLSIGVVRWNNVAPSMMHAATILNDGIGDDVDIFVIPYNGTLLPVIRHEVEKTINPLLKRKLDKGKDPALRNAVVRDALDNRATTKDVIIVMVTTSLEEVGRDHDFDWCITEPGSARGLVQMAGRILRHREMSPDATNVCVLQHCFREMRNKWSGKTAVPVFAYPGVETPLPDKVYSPSRKSGYRLTSHDASVVYDVETMSKRLDAREMISVESPKSELAKMERKATGEFLTISGADSACLSISEFANDPLSLLINHHPKNRKFRRSTGTDFEYLLSSDDGWKCRNTRISSDKFTTCNYRILPLEVRSDRLLLNKIDDPTEAADRLASNLWSDADDVPRWKLDALLTITRPLFAEKDLESTYYHYHLALGFTEAKDWTRPFF
jgi:hypothetical protein